MRFIKSKPIWTDEGTDADMNGAIFAPDFDGAGVDTLTWRFFGFQVRRVPKGHQYPTSTDVKEDAPMALIGRALEDEDKVFCRPDEKTRELLWSEYKTGGSQSIEIYRVKPEPERTVFYPLGIFAKVDGIEATHFGGMYWNSFRCVSQELLTDAGISTSNRHYGPGPAYDDRGAGAEKATGQVWSHVALWTTKRRGQGLCPGTCVATERYHIANLAEHTWPRPKAFARGTYQHFGDHVSWIRDEAIKFPRCRIRDFCMPATHDTGTYSLFDQMAEDPSGGAMHLAGHILNAMRDARKTLESIPGTSRLNFWSPVIKEIMWMSRAQDRTITGQLVDGVRGFDLRIYFKDEGGPTDWDFFESAMACTARPFASFSKN